MDEGYKNTLSPDHLERLAWFDERAGQVVPWPEPLPDKRHLATRAKGIYKPDGWDYALSIRILPGSRYEDGHPIQPPVAAGCCPTTKRETTRSFAWVHPLRWRRVRMFTPTMTVCSSGMLSTRRRVPASHARLLREYREDLFPAVLRVPAPMSRQRLYDLEPPAPLTVGRRLTHHRAFWRRIGHDNGHGFRVPRTREDYPDRFRAVAADVPYHIGDQLRRDGLGVVSVLAQLMKAERGPDVETRHPHRFRDTWEHECDQPWIEFYRRTNHGLLPFRACLVTACTDRAYDR